MDSFLKESVIEQLNVQGFIKLKYKNDVKRLPFIPRTYDDLKQFIENKVSPFKEGIEFSLYYFDDEQESITISDECDY